MHFRNLLICSLTLSLASCASGTNALPDAFPDGAEGVWKTNGYGKYLTAQNGTFATYDAAGSFCAPSNEEDESFVDYVDGFSLSEDGNRLTASISIDPHTYQLFRVDALPEACTQPADASPAGVFNAFADLMSEHYAFFDLYDIDWASEVETARAKVTNDMSDRDLFDLLASLLGKTKDAHVSLVGTVEGETETFDANMGSAYRWAEANAETNGVALDEARQQLVNGLWRDGVGNGVLNGEGTRTGNRRIFYGMPADGVGYLGIVTMGGYSKKEDPIADIETLDLLLDEAIGTFKSEGAKSVIVDVSFNHGGYDFISRQIASRFAKERTFVFSKSPDDAERPYTTDIWIDPSEREQFLGPVYLLTGDMTVSAGETFVLAMRPLENVTHIGESTRGALSDVLTKTLPNGWTLNMSNEIYLDHEGVLWEGPGIPPEITFDVFPKDDPIGGFQKAAQKAIEIASGN